MQLLSGFLIISPQHDHPKCINCQHLVGCVETMTYPWQRKCPMYDPQNPVPSPTREYYRLKRNAKLELLEEELEALGDERCIIWANYQEDCANIRELLKRMKIKYITPETDGSDLIFESDSSYRVYTGQVSQGIGTTLNSARTMIYYSYSLGLEDWLQSLERNYRIGQDKRVTVRRFMAQETVERGVIRLLEAKENIKDFLQSRVECVTCERGVGCVARGIIPYGDGCKLADIRHDVEKKRALRLRTIGKPKYEEPDEVPETEEMSA
jgi:SNF2 family DNA or RNA helicase